MMIRKIVGIVAVMTACAAFAADEEQIVSEQGEGAIGWTVAQAGLFAPVSYPWGCDWDVKGGDLSLLYMETVKFQGLGVSGIAMRTRGEAKGLFFSGFFNWNEVDVYGINLTFGVNLAHEKAYGLQGGLFAMRKHMDGVDLNLIGAHQNSFRGVQCAGVCNITLDEFTGGEISFGLNMATKIKGAQLGGINFAHQFEGCQLGFFNIAEECPNGIQIGLINIIMDNAVKVLPLVNFYFD